MDTLKYILKKYKIDSSQNSPITLECNRLTDLPLLFNELKFKKGAEIGVLGGVYSEILCRSNPDLKLYSIDAWQFYPLKKNFRRAHHYPPIYEEAINRLGQYPNNTIIKKWSMDALKDIKDGFLDFVFIDADHRYESVTADIAGWSKKVKKGGIVSGHDYSVRSEYVQVHEAVNAWTIKYNIEPWFILKSPINRNETSWMWVKT